MTKKETSLSHLLFISFLGWASSACDRQTSAGSDVSACEPLPAWKAAAEQEDDAQGLELLQLKGGKKVTNAANQEFPLWKLIELSQTPDFLSQTPPPAHAVNFQSQPPPPARSVRNPTTSSLCGHTLSGVDDKIVFANLAIDQKGIPDGSATAPSKQLQLLQQQKIFITAIMHNNMDILYHFTLELVRLLLALGGTSNPANFFVSIYESGSYDNTVLYLKELEETLKFLGVSNRIVTGGVTRAPGQHRIDFLAEMRNKAMEPLYESKEAYDRVLWLSDNLFCADGVLQMLAHSLPEAMGGLGADAVCGMDYSWGNGQTVLDRCLFYDKWASHDIEGKNFANDKPILRLHQPGQNSSNATDAKPLPVLPGPDNAKLEAKQPFQVFSCWNSMVAFSADLFQKDHLYFRRNRQDIGECCAAETELIFRDMWTMGRGKIVVSPSAASAYHEHDFTQCAAAEQPTQFDQTASAITWKPAPQMLSCCPLQPGFDMIEFWEACHTEDWNRFGVPLIPNASLITNETAELNASAGLSYLNPFAETGDLPMWLQQQKLQHKARAALLSG